MGNGAGEGGDLGLGRGPCEGRQTAPGSLESEADDAGVITVLRAQILNQLLRIAGPRGSWWDLGASFSVGDGGRASAEPGGWEESAFHPKTLTRHTCPSTGRDRGLRN